MTIAEIDTHLRELTPHQIRILQAVYDGGRRWLTRANVAKALNKRRLTPYDINCLKLLAEKGIIDESTQETTAPGSDFAYVYNMSEQMAVLIQEWWEQREQQMRQNAIPEIPRKPIRLLME